MKISDLLDVIEDDTVSIREQEVIASERIKEVTMKKIHENESENARAARPRRRLATGLIAAAIMLALVGTAVAAGQYWHSVDWNGREVENTLEEPMATLPPDAQVVEADDNAMAEELGTALEAADHRELIIARRADGRCEAGSRKENVASEEDVRALLAQENSGIIFPFSIPDEYVFQDGYVCYELSEGFDYTLVSAEERDGYTLERYTAPAEGDFISGYTLTFVDADGTELLVFADLREKDIDTSFGHKDGAQVEAFTVDSMENALRIEDDEHASVFLRQTLEQPISFTSTFEIMTGQSGYPNQYGEVVYELYLNASEADELVAMVTS